MRLPATLLTVIGVSWVGTGISALVRPLAFFEAVPGLPTAGLFNPHLVGDVGLAFSASGGLALWAVRSSDRSLALAATAWPLLHGLFHLQLWFGRGCTVDTLFGFDLVAVAMPALAAFGAATGLGRARP